MAKQTDTKQTLMETAIELIWQSNYASVGVAEICKRAGVTKGCFYHYFESKAELFYEAGMYYWEGFKAQLDAMYSPSYTPLEQLDNLIAFLLEKQEDKTVDAGDNPVSGCPFFTSGGQVGVGEDKVRQAAVEMSEKAMQYNNALVRSLKADGNLNGDADPAQLGRMLYQYVQGLLVYGRVMRDLDIVKIDLREALYRILDVKAEYRISGPELETLEANQPNRTSA